MKDRCDELAESLQAKAARESFEREFSRVVQEALGLYHTALALGQSSTDADVQELLRLHRTARQGMLLLEAREGEGVDEQNKNMESVQAWMEQLREFHTYLQATSILSVRIMCSRCFGD